MKPESAALSAVTAAAPTLPLAIVSAAVTTQFGLDGDYAPLVSERDQNFMMRTNSGEQYVVKVTSRFEEAATTDFQIAALLHLEGGGGVRVPQVQRSLSGTTAGRVEDDTDAYRLRVVSWVDGEPLESRSPDAVVAGELGAALARLDQALAGFSHPGETPALLWDLQRALELRELLHHIDDVDLRARVTRVLDDYEQNVVPARARLRTQVIHGDANPGNVLLSENGVGFIDFGDMVRAPLVFDAAIAASYLRVLDGDPLQLIAPLVAAYDAVLPFAALESDLFFDLVRARLATTVTLLYWRLAARDEADPYRQKALAEESGAALFLQRLDVLGRNRFREKLFSIQ